MVSRQFEPDRALELISPEYGSAYRIGGRLVLTAAHLLVDENNNEALTCKVRSKQFSGIEASVLWRAENSDIALIKLPESINPCEPVVFGQLPDAKNGEKIPFKMYGWPKWGQTIQDGYPVAGGRQIEGCIYLADTALNGLLVLEPERLPDEVSFQQSEWQGASGAIIICGGLVVAVQSQHQNPRRAASLAAEPLSKIYGMSQWCTLLQQDGISPEPETVSLSIGKRNG